MSLDYVTQKHSLSLPLFLLSRKPALSVTRLDFFERSQKQIFFTKQANICQTVWAILKNGTFQESETDVATFWAFFVKMGLLFASTTGHTGCSINLEMDVSQQLFYLLAPCKLSGYPDMRDQRLTIQGLAGGGGKVVSVLAFYSDNPRPNPAKVYNFNSVNCLKRTKENEKEAGNGEIKMDPYM